MKRAQKQIASAALPEPQWSPEAEQAVLGSILLRPETMDLLAGSLAPEDFYRTANQIAYRAMLGLYEAGEPVDLVTVTMRLISWGKLAEAGGPVYLAELSDHVGTAANAPQYAREVRQKAMLRCLMETAQGIAHDCLAHQPDPEGYLAQAEERVSRIREGRTTAKAFRLDDLAPAEITRLERIHESPGGILGVPSGLVDLDRLTSGWQPGDLILVAGRPSMGKTALGLNVCHHAAQTGTPAVFFSLEQPKEQLVQRYLAAAGNVNAWRMRSGRIRGDDWPQVLNAAASSEGLPLWIVDQPAMTMLDVRAQARQLSRRHRVGLVVLDYLQLVRDPRATSREQEVGGISRSLKALAKEINAPVIALAQLNRAVEQRPNKRPILSDLRESGSLEQDADLVLFLYRDEVYRENSSEAGIAELKLSKHRNGPTGLVKLAYRKEFMRFDNLAGEND